MLPEIVLKHKKEESLLRLHPWVFSGAIKTLPHDLQEGDLVAVLADDGTPLGTGYYQIGSIAVRMLSFNEAKPIDHDFWRARLKAALALRESLGLLRADNSAFRLVHGEGDRLPGLVIDYFDGVAVMQAHTVAMHRLRHELAEALADVLGDSLKAVFYKSEGTLPYKANTGAKDGYLYQCPEFDDADAMAIENGLRFRIDYAEGQKTGFFIDQRDNRALLRRYANGKRVLNLFGYTGGFSVYALQGGARLVHTVDSSARAIALSEENVGLNFPDTDRHEGIEADAFRFLQGGPTAEYDIVVLDPPAFAKHRDVLRQALRGYTRLNEAALRHIPAGSLLFTFSCSQAVSREQFRLAVFTAAARTGRHVRILHQLTQPADHPVSIYHPEGEYLKGLVLHVE